MSQLRRLLRRFVFGRPNGLRAWLVGLVKSSVDPVAEPTPEPDESPVAPEGYVWAAASEDLVDGQPLEVFVENRSFVLVRSQGEIFAVNGICPHAGGPLADGTLRGDLLACPYHGWAFSLRTGTCSVSETVKVERFSVCEQDGQVFIEASRQASVNCVL